MNGGISKDEDWELEEEELKKGTHLVFTVAIVLEHSSLSQTQGTGR